MEETFELQNSTIIEVFSNTNKRKFQSATTFAAYYNHEEPPEKPLVLVYPPFIKDSPVVFFKKFIIKDKVSCSFSKTYGLVPKPRHNTIFPIKFRMISFQSEVKIGWIKSDYNLTFWECNFNETLILEDLDYQEINFSECSHVENFIIKNCKIKRLLIAESNINRISIEGGVIESIEIKNTPIREVMLNSSFTKVAFPSFDKKLIEKFSITYSTDVQKSEFILDNFQINSFYINGIKSKDNSLILKDLEINNLEINDFSNEGTLRLHNVKFNENSNVKIDNSFLGKAELNNVDFSKVKEFYLSKSNVLDLITTNIKYPQNKEVYKGANEEERSELFRQLKTVSSKNREQERIFEGFELNIQEKITKNYNDKIVLFLNRVSNSHGQSWIRTSFLLLITIILSVEFILYSVGFPLTFSISKIIQEITWKISIYFDFINPTTKLNDFIKSLIGENKIIPSSTKIIFGITRLLFLPFLIYQLIAAFRKHGKKA